MTDRDDGRTEPFHSDSEACRSEASAESATEEASVSKDGREKCSGEASTTLEETPLTALGAEDDDACEE